MMRVDTMRTKINVTAGSVADRPMADGLATGDVAGGASRGAASMGCDERGNGLLGKVWWHAIARPDTPAFRSLGEEPTSYSQLWDLSTRLVAAISTACDDRSPIMVLGPKSALTVASFLACLRSGHAYVPIDDATPAKRVNDIAEQLTAGRADAARPTVVVSADASALDAGIDLTGAIDAKAVCDPTACDKSRSPESVAPTAPQLAEGERSSWVSGEKTQYIIFTSGSTGRPKGIEVSAGDVDNFMGWMETFPVVRDGGRTFLDQAPYSFDLSEFELVGALATGGCLYALSREAAHDYGLLFRELADSRADVWVSTPPFADLCLVDGSFGHDLLPQLCLFLFCGDTLTHRTASNLRERFPQARVANTYGPTESTVAVTYCEIDDGMLANPCALPVGRPRPGTELHVMRSAAPEGAFIEECRAGESGEIVISGDTVAKGYFNDVEKSAFAFGEATLADGRHVRTFRTGDIGHLDESGMLHYEGRMGSLVKVNGFRIELGDVENHLSALAGIKCAAVVPVMREGRASALRAFVVLDHEDAGANETPRAIRERLGRCIPSYMVPRSVRLLERMPLTSNAKIDRKQLMAS